MKLELVRVVKQQQTHGVCDEVHEFLRPLAERRDYQGWTATKAEFVEHFGGNDMLTRPFA